MVQSVLHQQQEYRPDRNILNMERVMKVMIRLLNILTELDILNSLHTAPQLFHVQSEECTSLLSSNQVSALSLKITGFRSTK